MPFEKRPVDPAAYPLLDRIAELTDAMRQYEQSRHEAARERSVAIGEARRLGLPLEAIAQRLGVTGERVRQMMNRVRRTDGPT
jgi:hypothetical protein